MHGVPWARGTIAVAARCVRMVEECCAIEELVSLLKNCWRVGEGRLRVFLETVELFRGTSRATFTWLLRTAHRGGDIFSPKSSRPVITSTVLIEFSNCACSRTLGNRRAVPYRIYVTRSLCELKETRRMGLIM